MQRYISLLTADEFKKSLDGGNGTVMIPVASTEQLGLHGPLGADVLVARAVAPLIAEKCELLYTDVVPFGDTLEMKGSTGTVSIPQGVLGEYYLSIARSFIESGARRIVFLMTHSLNSKAADYACRLIRASGCRAAILDWWKAVGASSAGIIEDTEYGTGHGAEMITSVVMAVAPDAVKSECATNEEPKAAFDVYSAHMPGSICSIYGNFSDYCTTGTWGDVRKASADKGRMLIEKAVELLSAELKATYGM